MGRRRDTSATLPREAPSSRSSILFPIFLAAITAIALVAFVLHSLRRLEQPPPRGYVEGVRARIAAETGLRAAISALTARSLREDVADLRSDWSYKQFEDRDGNGRYDGDGDEGEPLIVSGPGPEYDLATPLSRTLFPSFRAGEVILNGQAVGVSGALPDRGSPTRDTWALKVLDCASMIWVNGPLDEEGKLVPWVVRVLDTLGRLRGARGSLGGRIRQGRPASGFASKIQLRPILGDDYARVADLITVHAWVDPSTICPGAVRRPEFAAPERETVAAPWPWCAGDPLNDDGALFGPVIEGAEPPRAHPPRPGTGRVLEPRAPVDVNTACREVLATLFAGLEAETGALGKVTLSEERAVSLAEEILRRRKDGPFRSWPEVASFLDGLTWLSTSEKALVFANADPDSRLRSLNPSLALRRFAALSKDDLTERGRSTELCFGSMGYYDIESIGRVARGGRIEAERRVHTVVCVHERVHLATQYDFETHRRTAYGVATHPENAADFPGLTMSSMVHGMANGLSMADGHMEVAPRVVGGEGCSLAASFREGMDAETAAGDPAARGSANHGVSVLDPSDPSDLLADGFLARDAYVRFAALRSLPPEGTLEVWVKPDWDAAAVPAGVAGTRTFLCAGDARGWGAGQVPAERMALFFRDGQVNLYYGDTAGGTWGRDIAWPEGFPATAGEGSFGKAGMLAAWRAGEWHHLCVVWEGPRAWLLVDGAPAPGGPLVARNAPFAKGPGPRSSLFLGANRFGHHRSNGWEMPALATLAGLRVWPSARVQGRDRTGFPPPDRLPRDGGEMTLGLVREGVTGGSPARLGTLAWTWFPPPGAPRPEVSLLVDDEVRRTFEGEGEAVALDGLEVRSLSQVSVRVKLRSPPPPRRDSGAFGGLTVTVVHPTPRYLAWWEE